MDKPRDNYIFSYLPYCTLHDVLKVTEVRMFFLFWIMSLILTLMVGRAYEFTQSYFGFDIGKVLPWWAWASIAYAGVCWLYKGVHYEFPMVSFKSWLFLCLNVTAVLFVFSNFEWWVSWPFFWAVVLILNMLESLNGKGKENYQRMGNASGV